MESQKAESSKIHRQHDDWDEVHNQLMSVQKKSLEISDPNDAQEKEADEVARKVVDGQETSGAIQRKAENSSEKIQMQQAAQQQNWSTEFYIHFGNASMNLNAQQTANLAAIGNLINNYDTNNPGNADVTVRGGDLHMGTVGGATDAASRATTVMGAMSLTLAPARMHVAPMQADIDAISTRVTPPPRGAEYEGLGGHRDKAWFASVKVFARTTPFPNNLINQINNLGNGL